MPVHRKTLAELCYPYLLKFMRWRDKTECPDGHEFEADELTTIAPLQLTRHMKLLAYKTETPGPNDHPIHKRSSGLEFFKKAVSHFMPDRNAPWSTAGGTGNPTMSVAVNDLIKTIKKAEVRKLGKRSNAKRDLKREEFRMTLRLLERNQDLLRKWRIPTMTKLQWHIIGRADDTCRIETEDLRAHDKCPDCALQMKVSWSENVLEERDCPDQTLLGAMDSDFCVMIGLGCYLENVLTEQPNGHRFLFGNGDEDDEPYRINNRHKRTLGKTWKHEEMEPLLKKQKIGIGTHSIRKAPSTWAANHGKPQEHAEIRGRWKGQRGGKTVNRYISVDQLPTDAMMAACLAVGGPVVCACRPGADANGLSLEWMLENVVPKMAEHYKSIDESNDIAATLCHAVLFAAMEPGLECLLSDDIRNRIRTAWARIKPADFHDDWNPIVRIPLLVNGVEDALVIETPQRMRPDVPPNAPGPNGQPVTEQQQVQLIHHGAALNGHSAQLQMCLNMMHSMRNEMSELRLSHPQEIATLRVWMEKKFQALAINMNELRQAAPFAPRVPAPAVAAVVPPDDGGGVVHQGFAGGAGVPAGDSAVDLHNEHGPARANAHLSKRPKSLHDLWKEYQTGIGGMMPAKHFNARERGRCEDVCSKRNLVWSVVKDFVVAGIDADVALDKIYQAHGHNQSVTKILTAMSKARREAGGKKAVGESWKHPNLRMGVWW